MRVKQVYALVISLLMICVVAACRPRQEDPVIESISITPPTVTEYQLGATIDLTGLVVKAKMSDGTEINVSVDDVIVTGFNSSFAGDKTITVTYAGKTATFVVKILSPDPDPDPNLVSIYVTPPTKVIYYLNEEFDATGMIVSAIYDDNSMVDVTGEEINLTGFDSSFYGEKTITVTYNSKTSTFKVNITMDPDILASIKDNAIGELNDYKNISSFSESYRVYYNEIKGNWVSLINDAISEEGISTILVSAKAKLSDVYNAMVDDSNIAEWIIKSKNPFESTWPKFTSLPVEDVLTVDRGFNNDVMTFFDITAEDYAGKDVTSMISIIGDPNFVLSGNYDIQFEAVDDYGNKTLSRTFTLDVEPVIGNPTFTFTQVDRVLNQRTIVGYTLTSDVVVKDVLGFNITDRVEIECYNAREEEVEFTGAPGFFKVYYYVSDVDGNEATAEREITVMPNTAVLDTELVEITSVTPTLMYFNSTTILDWVPVENDPYVNKATIPLQPRVKGEGVNPNANSDVRVAILDQITEQVNGVQKFQGFDEYMIEYYQYMDIAVSWNGTGNITAPTSQVINAFHKNGVKILGNIFMKPSVYGGSPLQQEALVQKDENGKYIVGEKLIDIAHYYGFDGWFINLETDYSQLDEAMATEFQNWCLYMQALIRQRGYDMEIMWYDSMIKTGRISWQGLLNSNNEMFFQNDDQVVNNSMFLDFAWYKGNKNLQSAVDYAVSLGRNPYDLYAGIDTQAYGYRQDSQGVTWRWNLYFDPVTKQPLTSLGIYMSSWVFSQDNKNPAPNTYRRFIINSRAMWVGPNGDPRTSEVDLSKPTSWYGISSFVLEKTAIIGDSFHTTFSTGNGNQFYLEGEQVTDFTSGWNNLDTQDILPTWRWIADNISETPEGDPLTIALNHEYAYRGGSSLLISGDLTTNNDSEYMVYKTYLDIYQDTTLQMIYQTNDTNVDNEIILYFEDENGNWYIENSSLGLAPSDYQWTNEVFDLSEHAGKKLTAIGFRVSTDIASPGYKLRFGEMSIHRTLDNFDLETINNIQVESNGYQYGRLADARLSWSPINSSDGYIMYEVYYEDEDGELVYLRSSYSNYVYVQNIERELTAEPIDVTKIHIQAYDKYGRLIAKSYTTFDWEEPIEGGRARFSVNTSLIASTGSVTFTPIISPITESVEWTFYGVENEDIVYNENGTVTVTYNYQGVYDVKLVAINQYGRNELLASGAVVVSDAASKVSDVTENAKIHDFSGFVVGNEHPRFLIDGNRNATKWCETTATTAGPKWVILDFRENYYFSKFDVYHAGAVEQASYNTVEFEIHASTDGVNFDVVVRVENNTANYTTNSITPVEARYIRIYVINGGSDDAARIYELVCFGRLA